MILFEKGKKLKREKNSEVLELYCSKKGKKIKNGKKFTVV